MKLRLLLFMCVLGTSLFSGESNEPRGRSDQLPQGRFNEKSNVYKEAYLQALVDMHYYEFEIKVRISGDTAYLTNLPKNHLLSESILNYVGDFPGIKRVEVVQPTETPAKVAQGDKKHKEQTVMSVNEAFTPDQVSGIWFPQSNLLFPALIADPLHVAYSGSMRFNDDVLGNTSAFVSFGDHFPIYRWIDVWPYHGDMEIGLEGAAWAYFDLSNDADLINTDYYVAIPLTYSFDNWAFRLRLYHISGHLGDEYIIKNPAVQRLNTSLEVLDCFALYDFSSSLRAYGGVGWVLKSDEEYKVDPLYVEGGAEVRLFGKKNFLHRLYLQPFYAMHFRFWQDHDWEADLNFALGVELSKLQNVGRRVRLYAVYHDGQSFIGQFSRQETKYWGLVFSYGF